MKVIKVRAEIILTVPHPTQWEANANNVIIFDVEQKLNEIGILQIPERQTHVGIRFHFLKEVK